MAIDGDILRCRYENIFGFPGAIMSYSSYICETWLQQSEASKGNEQPTHDCIHFELVISNETRYKGGTKGASVSQIWAICT